MFRNSIKNFLKTYNSFIYNRPWIMATVFILLTTLSVLCVTKLPIKTDFFELLPEHYQSVKDLQSMIKRIGGVGNLIIAVETDDFEAGKKYVERLAGEIKKLPKDLVTDVDYNVKDVKQFYEDNGLFFVDKEDLITIKERLAKKIEYEKKKNSPFLIFKETIGPPVEFNVDDIKQKYENKNSNFNAFKDGYISGYNGTLLVIMIRPYGTAAGVTLAKKLISEVDKIIASIPVKDYHSSIKTHYCGNFKSVSEEYDVIINDVTSTLILVFLLVGGIIFLMLGTFTSIFILLVPLAISTVWTLGITYLYIGYLNSQTAFLASLIVGTGVNYGIIYLARYYEERKSGKDILKSINIASEMTAAQTFLASSTTAAAFITLLFAHNRGFIHFGFIGSIGVTLCWINTFLCLPLFIQLFEYILHTSKASKINLSIEINPVRYVTKYIIKYHAHLFYSLSALSIISIVAFALYSPNSLEYDFSKLRNSKSHEKGTAYWDERVGNIFDTSLTPSLIVVDDEKYAEPVCKSIEAKIKELDPKFAKIATCHNLDRNMPTNQVAKIPVIKEIKDLLYTRQLKFLNDEDYDKVVDYREKIKLNPITMKDLPHNLTKHFEDEQGNNGVVVMVNPRMELKEGENLITFAELVRENKMPDGTIVRSSGESVIFADLLKAISIDGPRVTILAFILVVFLVVIVLRHKQATIVITTSMLVGVILMLGFISFFGIKLNFFNFIALPLTFGIGVDYSVNLYTRYKQDGDLVETFVTIGNAVLLCSLTTVLSYITLIIAKNQALVSFGQLALIGEITSIIGAFLFMPGMVILWEKLKKKK